MSATVLESAAPAGAARTGRPSLTCSAGNRRRTSLRRKLVTNSLFAFALLLPLYYFGETRTLGEAYRQGVRRSLAEDAGSITALFSVTEQLAPREISQLASALLRRDTRVARIVVLDRDKNIVAGHNVAHREPRLLPEEIDSIGHVLRGGPVARLDETCFGKPCLTFVEGAHRANEVFDGTAAPISRVGAVLVSFDLSTMQQKAQHAIFVQMITGLVVFSIILIVLYSLLSRSFVQPIAALTEAAARLSGGDIETRVRVPPQSEIGNLALAFNEMASRIQDTRQRLLGANEALKTNNERLSRSNVDLQAFVYAASHDLREPLRMVNSYLGLIDRRLQDRGELHEFLDFARDGASRMKRLLDDLLIYCRLEGGQVRSAEESLAVVAQEARDNLRLVFEETSAELSIGVLPTVLASHSQLLQLFQNLLSNAIKFRSAERPHIRISADRADQEWTVRISDNGIGFDPAEAERIFSAFHRLHSHAAIPGSGLGLAICQRIVVGWGGRIWATSQPGRGATFHFTFPRERIVRNDA